MSLTILTWNTLFGGRDGADASRAELQIDVVTRLQPDVFLMQEAKGFEARASELLHGLERRLGMRGFLATAPRTGQNVAIFVRHPLEPTSFEADGEHFHHAAGTLRVALPGGAKSLTLVCVHLCPNDPASRRTEAACLTPPKEPGTLAVLAGDFNSASPHDSEPPGFEALAPHHRTRYLGEDGQTADRTVLTALETAGWVDVGYRLGASRMPTVPCAAFLDTEFPTMRCDYVLATPALAQHAVGYDVIRTPQTDAASDHYPVVAKFEGLI